MNYIDSHFHLDLVSNPIACADEIEKRKIYTIAVTNSPKVFFYTFNITRNKKFLRPALGLHPELAFQRKIEVELFKSEITKTRYIGEIGLDNYKKSKVDYTTQISVFERLLSICADEGDKIITMHSRCAETDVISMVGNDFPGKIILHWFSGSLKELELAIRAGFYFSVNLAMTKSANGRKIIQAIPSERILTETDGPFIEYNEELCTPLHCINLIKEISILRPSLGSTKEIQAIVYGNFRSLIT